MFDFFSIFLSVFPRYSGDARVLDKELGDWLHGVPLQVAAGVPALLYCASF